VATIATRDRGNVAAVADVAAARDGAMVSGNRGRWKLRLTELDLDLIYIEYGLGHRATAGQRVRG